MIVFSQLHVFCLGSFMYCLNKKCPRCLIYLLGWFQDCANLIQHFRQWDAFSPLRLTEVGNWLEFFCFYLKCSLSSSIAIEKSLKRNLSRERFGGGLKIRVYWVAQMLISRHLLKGRFSKCLGLAFVCPLTSVWRCEVMILSDTWLQPNCVLFIP